MARRRLGVVVVAALALALAACGVPTQSAPSSIARGRVPFGLLQRQVPVTTTTTTPHHSFVPVHVFFLSSTNQLVSVERVVYVPATLDSILTALLAGPDSTESTSLRTAIPNDVNVISAMTTAPGIVTVNFDDGFSQISGGNAELAVSQVVDTVATQNGLGTGVEFEVEGQHTSVPIANGSTVPGPVYLLQFVNPPSA